MVYNTYVDFWYINMPRESLKMVKLPFSSPSILSDMQGLTVHRRDVRLKLEAEVGVLLTAAVGALPPISAAGDPILAISTSVDFVEFRRVERHRPPLLPWPGSPSVLYPTFPAVALRGRFRPEIRSPSPSPPSLPTLPDLPPIPFPEPIVAGARRPVTFFVVFTDYPTASPSSELPIPTIGQPWGAADSRNLFGLPPQPGSHLPDLFKARSDLYWGPRHSHRVRRLRFNRSRPSGFVSGHIAGVGRDRADVWPGTAESWPDPFVWPTRIAWFDLFSNVSTPFYPFWTA